MTSPDIRWPRPAGPLVLRLPTDADIDRVLTWRNRPDVSRWLLRTHVDPDAVRAEWLAALNDPDDHAAVAALDGVVVATASLHVTDGMGQIESPDVWQRSEGTVGYVVDPAYAGRGFATAIGGALLELAFGELGLHRVTAGCFAANVASWRVMEKIGMRREQHGVQDSWHAELGWIDGYTYAILADEWQRSRGR